MNKTQMSKSNRLLAMMGGGLVVLVVVAAVFAALREPTTFDPDTPEGTTQAYLTAVLDDEPEAAHALLTPELQIRCTVDDLENRYRRDSGQITLIESEIDGDTAKIDLKFSFTYNDGPFEFSQSSYDERFELERVAGEWRIADVPWPFYWCSGEDN